MFKSFGAFLVLGIGVIWAGLNHAAGFTRQSGLVVGAVFLGLGLISLIIHVLLAPSKK